jgi:hypothetical protein
MIDSIKAVKTFIEETRPWNRSSRSALYRDYFLRERKSAQPYDKHLRATIDWLRRAQDAAGDGGVCGRYHIGTGWSRSYPETTGYIAATFLAAASRFGDSELASRAERMIDYLLGLQMPDGAFPGGEVGASPQPVVFNTGQIINGLLAWHRHSGDARALDAAVRAGTWLVKVQDPDGSWRAHTYGGVASTYHAHAAWPLAECGRITQRMDFMEAASRHADWIMTQADRGSGWIDCMGFYKEDHTCRRALTHTIGYTYRGLLGLGEILGRDDCSEVVRTGAEHLMRSFELKGRLSGVFDHRWGERADYVCLTGCAQLASVWTLLYARTRDLRFVNAALKAADFLKNTQALHRETPQLCGAIAGSFPIWGGYLRWAFPNWAAKFFVDALMQLEDCLREIRTAAGESLTIRPSPAPQAEMMPDLRSPRLPYKVVLLSTPRSTHGCSVAESLHRRGVCIAHVVLDVGAPSVQPLRGRVLDKLRSQGARRFSRDLAARVSRRWRSEDNMASEWRPSIEWFCKRHCIPLLQTPGINTAAARDLLHSLRPDFLVLAGVGIVRDSVIRSAGKATLNGHMGILPAYRGMNVAEWAFLAGDPVGCSVHQVDSGIDTGRIFAVEEVPTDGIRTIEQLRERVSLTQVELLAKVAAALVSGIELPSHSQGSGEGRQFFRMHAALREILSRRLADQTAAAPAQESKLVIEDAHDGGRRPEWLLQ